MLDQKGQKANSTDLDSALVDWLQWDRDGKWTGDDGREREHQWTGYSGTHRVNGLVTVGLTSLSPAAGPAVTQLWGGGFRARRGNRALLYLVSLIQVSCVRGDVSTAESPLSRSQLGCNWTTAAPPLEFQRPSASLGIRC